VLAQFSMRRIDENTLEVDIGKEQNLNALFEQLSAPTWRS